MKIDTLMNYTLLSTCTLAVLFAIQAPAAEPDQPKETESQVAKSSTSDGWSRRLKSIVMNNEPLSAVASFLRDEFPEVNFVTTGNADETRLNLYLRNVTLDEILTALVIASDHRVEAEISSERLVALKCEAQAVEAPMLRAFNLAPYLANHTDKNADEALKELYEVLLNAWEMLAQARSPRPKMKMPELSIHEKTKLLIAVGQREQLAIVEQVVNALQFNTPIETQILNNTQRGGYGSYGGSSRYGTSPMQQAAPRYGDETPGGSPSRLKTPGRTSGGRR